MHSVFAKNNYKIIAKLIVFFVLAIIFLFPNIGLAQTDILEGMKPIQEQTGLGGGDLRVIIAKIIRVVLGFVGVIMIIIVLYAGFLWMTSAGDEAKVNKAKAWLLNGIIGLIIIFSAYSIVSFVISKLLKATGAEIGTIAETGMVDVGGSGLGGGALGKVIVAHWPGRNQTDVPRNTNIMVKFAIAFKPESVLIPDENLVCPENVLCGKINSNNIKIYQLKDQEDNQWPSDESKLIKEGIMTVSSDHKIFVFNPYGDEKKYLGSAKEDVTYVVYLTHNIKKDKSEKSIFTDAKLDDYAWIFTTGTTIDETPPYITSVIPYPKTKDEKFARNYIIQINFNEPMIPLFHQTAQGNEQDKTNEIIVKANDNDYISGTFETALNNFKTIEFITDGECEGVSVNSCGQKIYCLPADAVISVLVKAATLAKAPQAKFPYDGLVDAAGNSLDGNHNKIAQGPPTDNYQWEFVTSGEIDVTPPKIIKVEPGINASDVQPDALIKISFNKSISAESLFGNISLKGEQWDKWYTSELEDAEDLPSSIVVIDHGAFDKVPEEENKPALRYYPIVGSGIQDLLQNCFHPCQGPGCPNASVSCCPDIGLGAQKQRDSIGCGL